MKLNKAITFIFLIVYSISIKAQSTEFTSSYYDTGAIFFLLLIAAIFIAFLYYGQGEGKKSEPVKKKGSIFQLGFVRRFITGLTPVEKENDILLEHNFDGIKELDNRIPPWFNYLFYGSILFAVYYMLDYHVFESGKLQAEEYAEEMNLAQQQRDQLARSGAFISEESVTFAGDSETLQKGKELFIQHCTACHAADGGGLIGPNLTDKFWIHGGDIKNVFKVIKYGVPAKGMISWQQQLNPLQMQDVARYILSLQGTSPQNPKQPEGTPYTTHDTLKTLSVK